MKNDKFYGLKARITTAENFFVIPILHTCVFKFQKIISECSGKVLEEKAGYYLIKLIDKKDKTKESMHYIARNTAENLLTLASQPKLKLFNPIIDEFEDEDADESTINNSDNVTYIQEENLQFHKGNILNNNIETPNNFPQLNREAFRAVNLVILSLGIDIHNITGNWEQILYWSQKKEKIKTSAIKGFNTSLKKLGSMKYHIEKIEKKGYGKVKKYSFPQMKKVLSENYGLKEDEINL